MKVEIKPILGSKDYKVFRDSEFLGYIHITPEDKWLYNLHPDITLKSIVFDSYDELFDYMKWSDY